jgi:hypothetical protein
MAAPSGRTSAGSALRCSFAAELRGDPLIGTASPATGLLLVEQPGPWGRLALVQSRLDPAVGSAISARAVAEDLRVLLIRRPGRDLATARRRWALADCTPGQESIRWGNYGADDDLLDLPLDGTAGELSDEPCFLVCTHGRHDACCAIRGRPVAAALAAERPAQVWECSHVGGDRFAANLVALPHGLYYGWVDEANAADLAATHDRGEVTLELLRGRTAFAPVTQAAQHHARQLLGKRGINELTPRGLEAAGRGRWRVRLAHRPRDLVVTVRSASAGPSALLTCAASHRAHPPVFVVEDVRGAD